MNMNMIDAAKYIADKWHNRISKQVRKYTNEPYTVHTVEVAEIYGSYFPGDFIGVAAGHLHDVIEDTPITENVLNEELRQLTM